MNAETHEQAAVGIGKDEYGAGFFVLCSCGWRSMLLDAEESDQEHFDELLLEHLAAVIRPYR